MVRRIERLTTLQVSKASVPGYYADGAGLYLQVAAGGSKSWLLRYVLHGRQRWMGLGSCRTFTLAEARDRARRERKTLADGIDPIDAKRSQQRAARSKSSGVMTFDEARDRFLLVNASGWRNTKHADQWLSTLRTYASPIIGKLPVGEVDAPMIVKILEPIWSTKTETASRLRGRIEKILDWSKVHGHRDGDNPAAWRGQLSQVLPRPTKVAKVEHHPALPWREASSFMQDLREMPGMAALATRFIVLTASLLSSMQS